MNFYRCNELSAGRSGWSLYPGLLLAMLGLCLGAASVSAQTNAAGQFMSELRGLFVALDRNDDGELSVSELDVAVANEQITGPGAAAVAALKRATRTTRYQLPPLTLDNLQGLATNAPATNRPNLGRMFGEGLRQITNAPSRELFASGRPQLQTIRQGKLGNCFTLAPLGALVHRDPEQVMRMFSRQADGLWRVQLGAQAVTVAPPTDAELALTAGNEQDGVWVNVYEKAVGKARNDLKPVEEQSATAIDALARGGSAGTMLAFITGHEMVRFSFKFAKDAAVTEAERTEKIAELKTKLAEAVRERRLMTCGTLRPTTPGIRGNHAYAVLNYDRETGEVQVWDPHGDSFQPKGEPGPAHGYPRVDGIYRLPVEEFVRQFSGMAFEVLPVTAEVD